MLNARNEIPQVCVALFQRHLARFHGAFVGAIFDFDANRTRISCIGQCRKELSPVNAAHPRQFGCVIFTWMRKYSYAIESFTIDPCVLGMDVEQSITEVADRRDVVHLLPDQVGRIVVESKVIAGNVGKESFPDCRTVGDVSCPRAIRRT